MALILFSAWTEFVQSTVARGYVVALAVICLLQYAAHLYRLARERRAAEQRQQELVGMENALNLMQKDRTLARYENQILREFVSQTECDKAMGLLLRRFVPDTDNGFGAFLQLCEGQVLIDQSRGLSQPSCDRLNIDPALVERLRQQPTVVLEGAALQHSALYARLAKEDRGKVRQLYLLALGEPDELVGILLTTDLFPAGAERRAQLELAGRLMLSVGCSLKHKQTLESQQLQLRSTGEMLQLRAIADHRFDTPVKMIEEFLRQLAEKVGADRAALYLATQQPGGSLKALVRCGETLQPGLREQWQKYETTLATTGFAVQELVTFDAEGLERAGIRSLIGSALLIPLVQLHGRIGILILTRRHRDAFAREPRQLAAWAAEFLADTILRAFSQHAVEMQARSDGLTQLANRRTFDQQINQELQLARNAGSSCSLILFDLDRFKTVNDTHGHRAGDHVLRSVAALLRDRVSKIRSGDRALVARYGGEELAVVLPGIGSEGALRIAETIRAGVESLAIDFEGINLPITTSAGLATFPEHADLVDDLIAAADAALYQAKARGRNRTAVAEPSLV